MASIDACSVAFSVPRHGRAGLEGLKTCSFKPLAPILILLSILQERRGSMSRYCIWFVTPDDTVMRRAEVAINGSIHCHQVLEEIEAQLAMDCGLSQVMIVDWKRFEPAEGQSVPLARAVA
jgi:hypothetical protein